MTAFSFSIRSRGYLPHAEKQNPIYFVTFRLADSLPRQLIDEIQRERRQIERAAQSNTNVAADRNRLMKLNALLRKAESYLDKGLGRCHMSDPRIAEIVARTIRHFDAQRYQLLAWCVMPNHVHILFSPLRGVTLASTLQTWKSYSAHQANAALRRAGVFWQREYFDHLVRNESRLLKFARYIERNPQNAGLKNWPWVSNTLCTAGVSPASFPFRSASASPTRRPESGVTKEPK